MKSLARDAVTGAMTMLAGIGMYHIFFHKQVMLDLFGAIAGK